MTALGVAIWPMIEFEADDALAAAALTASQDPRVERVLICTPDKDLAQCVRGTRVVQMDRRTPHHPGRSRHRREVRRAAGVDSRLPGAGRRQRRRLSGTAGWGAKSSAAVLAKYGRLEYIPADWRTWSVNAANPASLARTLERDRDRAFLFRNLATLREDIPLFDSIDELRWNGPTPDFPPLAARFDAAVTATPGRPSSTRRGPGPGAGPVS